MRRYRQQLGNAEVEAQNKRGIEGRILILQLERNASPAAGNIVIHVSDARRQGYEQTFLEGIAAFGKGGTVAVAFKIKRIDTYIEKEAVPVAAGLQTVCFRRAPMGVIEFRSELYAHFFEPELVV